MTANVRLKLARRARWADTDSDLLQVIAIQRIVEETRVGDEDG